jgi:hypothetical protein
MCSKTRSIDSVRFLLPALGMACSEYKTRTLSLPTDYTNSVYEIYEGNPEEANVHFMGSPLIHIKGIIFMEGLLMVTVLS